VTHDAEVLTKLICLFAVVGGIALMAVGFELREIKEALKLSATATNQGLLDLQASIAALTTQDATVATALQTLASTNASQASQIAALQAQLAAGTEVTDAQLEQLAQTSNSAQAAVAAALTAIAPPAQSDAAKKSA